MTLQPTIHYADFLTIEDYAVFTTIILITLGTVLYGKSKGASSDHSSMTDYLIMGRSLTLPMFTATLVATWYGGIFGVTELAFQNGIYNFVTQGVFWYITYLVFAFFIVGKVKASQSMTLPEMVGQMFGPLSGKISGIFNLFNVLPIAYAISLGIFIQALFGLDFPLSVVAGTMFVGLYSMFGGFRSVVYSDLVQFFVMCLSVAMVLVFSISTWGGLTFLIDTLPEHYFSPLSNKGLATTLVWGFIAASTLVDPNFYQRCFAAKDSQTAKRGILCATGIWICFDLCTTFGAMYARAVIPESSPKYSYLIYAVQLLPNGLRGFFLAGMMATILSTLDSYLNIASTTISYDFLKVKKNNRLWLARGSTVMVTIISISMALAFEGSIKDVWKTLGSYSAGCLLLPILIGYMKPGLIKDKSFATGSICGVIGITYWRFSEHSGFAAQIDDLYVGILATASGLLVGQLREVTSRPRT